MKKSNWLQLQQEIVQRAEKQNVHIPLPIPVSLNCDTKKWKKVCTQYQSHHVELAVLWMHCMETSNETVIELIVTHASFIASDIVSKLDKDSYRVSTKLIKDFWKNAHMLPECFGKIAETQIAA